MSKLRFKDHEYTYEQLFELSKKSPLYKDGDVVDLENGEVWDLKDIKTEEIRLLYFSEVITEKYKENIINNIVEREDAESLEIKFKNNTIKKIELLKLIKLKKMNHQFSVKYDKFFTVNMSKNKPENITPSEYGRFFMMLNYVSYKNKIEYTNGKTVKLKSLSVYLGFNTSKTCVNYLSKLKKYKLMATIESGGIKFIAINPAYAQRNMRVNRYIYRLFESDLKICFNEYEIRYLKMEDDDLEIDSLIYIQEPNNI